MRVTGSGYWPTPQVSGRIQGKMKDGTIWKTCVVNGGQIHLTGQLRLMGVSPERYPLHLGLGDGMAGWMERLKATGNGQVPAVVPLAWKILAQNDQAQTQQGQARPTNEATDH